MQEGESRGVYFPIFFVALIFVMQDFHKTIPVHVLLQASHAANCIRSTHFWDIMQCIVLILSLIS